MLTDNYKKKKYNILFQMLSIIDLSQLLRVLSFKLKINKIKKKACTLI